MYIQTVLGLICLPKRATLGGFPSFQLEGVFVMRNENRTSVNRRWRDFLLVLVALHGFYLLAKDPGWLRFFVVLTIVLILLHDVFVRLYIAYLRKRGDYPVEGNETLASVHALAKRGHFFMAVRCYRSITGAPIREAVDFCRNLPDQ
jgi:hypothetical protein